MRIGTPYQKLWSASAVSTLGDGVFLVSLPLLAAELTRDPLPVSLVSFAGWLPWLLFGLISGALVDRWDRRVTMWRVDAFRFAVVGGLGLVVLAGWASIPLVCAFGFLLGTGQTLFDNAAQSLIPALASRDPRRLERANSQLYGAQMVSQNFLGPPAGGFLFGLANAVPFLVDAVSFLASSAMIAAISGRFAPQRPPGSGRPSLRAEIGEGLRWLGRHRLLRALSLLVAVMNLSFMAGEAIMVLFAQDVLGLTNLGYGLLLTGFAGGGVLGTLLATRIGRVVGTGTLLVLTSLVGAASWLGFGVNSTAWVGGLLLVMESTSGMVFNVVGVSLRQAIVPDHLIGRVVAAYRTLGYGAIPLGSVLGGVIGKTLGLRAPYLFGGALVAVSALLALPVVNDRAVQAARDSAESLHPATEPG
ncbi:MAG TPA: MFS transporter [Actinomycetota bacterium]|jgi:MFS family permease|nr:MFS transporter [Actinomycetota bacterium]